MENNINNADGKLSSMIEELIKVSGEAKEEKGQPEKHQESTKIITCEKNNNTIHYSSLVDNFFNSLNTSKCWWDKTKLFILFVLLAGLATLVFFKCFSLWKYYDNYFLLFFFGVIVLLFAGLVVVACFLVKKYTKQQAEEFEQENKILAFKQKILEISFELENRNMIYEKQSIVNRLSIMEKEYLYSLDEKQCMAEHKRKMQLKNYDILEAYMKHINELEKTNCQKIKDEIEAIKQKK